MSTGIDIVKQQIKIAAGNQLDIDRDDITIKSHALECRINAEDPVIFLPSPGTIHELRFPHGPAFRVDEGIYEGYNVPFYYDSLLMKFITWGKGREEAIFRMKRALAESPIKGVKTTIPLHRAVLEDKDFLSGMYSTSLLNKLELKNKILEKC
ncbi:MAG: hypothetical protein ABFD50_23805 [Smithella sp.]